MKYLRKFARSLARLSLYPFKQAAKFASRFDARDMFLFAGLGLVSYGLTLVWLPAAFIVPGLILLYVAVFKADA
tara:strand:+ start:8308 stop:8529 length:222 start_codon:yes stop_codon:yes gene_type:complete